MKQFFCGVMVGLALSGSAVLAGNLYDRQGNLQAPRGSQESFDYFRQRGTYLDLQALRREAERQRVNTIHKTPCEK
jgi:hypothetical protein